MKRILLLIISAVLLICLTGCSFDDESKNNEKDTSITENVEDQNVEEESEKEPEVIIEDESEEEDKDEPEENTTDVTELYYWVNFLNKDGTTLSRQAYKYGTVPSAPSNPTYYDGVYYYSFIGWDKPISAVHMTQVYTAKYEITGTVYHEPEKKYIYINGTKCEKGAIIELEDYDDDSDGIADTHKYLILAMGSTITKEDDGAGNKYHHYNGTTQYDSINEFVEGEGNQLLLLSMETWKCDKMHSSQSLRYFDKDGDALLNTTFYGILTNRVKNSIVEEYITKTVMTDVNVTDPVDESKYDAKTFTNWKVDVGIRDDHKIDTYYDIDESNGWNSVRMPRKVYVPDVKELIEYAKWVHQSCNDNKEYDYCFEDLMTLFSVESVSDMSTKFGDNKLWTRSEKTGGKLWTIDGDKNKLHNNWLSHTNRGIRPEFVLDTDLYLNYTEAPE